MQITPHLHAQQTALHGPQNDPRSASTSELTELVNRLLRSEPQIKSTSNRPGGQTIPSIRNKNCPGCQPIEKITREMGRDIINSIGEGIVVYDRNLYCLVWNSCMEQMTGLASSVAVGLHALELFPHLDKAGFDDCVQRSLSGECVVNTDFCHKASDGKGELWTSEAISPYRDATGNIVGVIDVVRDITARKQMEAKLQRSEERFREMADNIQEVFWMVTPDASQILYANAAYEKIWGFTVESLYKNPGQWLDAVHPEDKPRMTLVSSQKIACGETSDQFRIIRKDGQVRWMRSKSFPIRDVNGKVTSVVGLSEDITESKDLETQFLRAQRLESIAILAGGIAHDLNNVLSPIMMGLQLLSRKLEDEQSKKNLKSMQGAVQRGAEMVKQILSFARGTEDSRVLIQGRHVMLEVEKIIKGSFPKNIECLRNIPNDLFPFKANATQVHQVLMNLSVNARDAMPHGGNLTLKAENIVLNEQSAALIPQAKPGSYVMISVADTGTGMTPEVRSKIFQPFFTTKEQGKGTGLGLSTVASIVRAHEGFVHLTSELRKGTEFQVFFPAEPTSNAQLVPEARQERSRGNGELILVVDDEVSICEVAREILESDGYRVLTAADGIQAVSLVAHNKGAIQMVITDLLMPYMDGMSTIRTVQDVDPKVRFLVCSGVSSQQLIDETEMTAIRNKHPFLHKPFTSDEFLEAVSHSMHPHN